MARFIFMSVAAAFLMLFQGAYATAEDPTVSQSPVCFTEMNSAREAVGYAPFQATTEGKGKLPLASDENGGKAFWQKVCADIQGNSTSRNNTNIATPNGIVAYFKQTSENPDCPAAIEYFKSGFALIGTELPPAYTANTKPYNNEKAMSFFALYNPAQGAAAECQVVTCPGDSNNKDYGLVCLSYPPFTDGQAPYNEKDWKKITDVFASSASVAVPSLLVLAATAVGLTLR